MNRHRTNNPSRDATPAKRIECTTPPDELAADGSAPGAPRRVHRWTLAVVGVAALVAVGASSDRERSSTDPVEECEDYAAALRRCFGEKAALTASHASTAAGDRAARAKRCAADRARIERACR